MACIDQEHAGVTVISGPASATLVTGVPGPGFAEIERDPFGRVGVACQPRRCVTDASLDGTKRSRN
jgi:hypothetical protein